MSIPKTDSTDISYYRLGEYEKFRQGFLQSNTIISRMQSEIKALESVSSTQEQRISNYEFTIVPALKNQLGLSLREVEKLEELGSLRQEAANAEIKRQKGKKWSWGTTGLSIGIVLGFIASLFL